MPALRRAGRRTEGVALALVVGLVPAVRLGQELETRGNSVIDIVVRDAQLSVSVDVRGEGRARTLDTI